jgi:hypothetical protein
VVCVGGVCGVVGVGGVCVVGVWGVRVGCVVGVGRVGMGCMYVRRYGRQCRTYGGESGESGESGNSVGIAVHMSGNEVCPI